MYGVEARVVELLMIRGESAVRREKEREREFDSKRAIFSGGTICAWQMTAEVKIKFQTDEGLSGLTLNGDIE